MRGQAPGARGEGREMAMRRHPEPRDGGDPRPAGPAGPRLDELYRDHLTAVYRFIYSKVGNREEAEDLTSQVFVKAVRNLDEARSAESVLSWLFRVARTTIADHWRRVYRLRVDSLDDLLDAGWQGPTTGGAEPVLDVRPEQRVQRLLQQLPPRYREVLTYRFLQGASVRETAQRMQLSEANVKVLQFRALRRAAELDRGCARPAVGPPGTGEADVGPGTGE
jgi:RNA polymerase sigma-70 factor (ECF subfamily)